MPGGQRGAGHTCENNMTTIRIKSTDEASQGPFVTISLADFNAEVHTPFDEEAHEALAGAVQSGAIVPSMAELMSARDQLLARANELDDRELQLNQRGTALDDREQGLLEREQANAQEAQRLADLAAARSAAPDFSTMTKDELQAALKEKGIDYPSTANKADLVALLTAP
jgi:hypothetical protein